MLKLDLALALVVDPTVIAFSAKAGEKLQASAFELPEATTTVIPASVAAPMARVYDGSAPLPPKLMEIIDGFTPFVVTQSIAAICQDRDPDPWSDRVFTERTVASDATPKVVPAAEPCPL